MEPNRPSNREDTAFTLEMLLNSLIMTTSFLMATTGEETIDFLIEALKRKKEGKVNIVCGSLKLNGTMSQFTLKESSKIIQGLIEEKDRKLEEEAEALWEDTVAPILAGARFSKHRSKSSEMMEEKSDTRSEGTLTRRSERPSLKTTKTSEEHLQMVRAFQRKFGDCRRKAFEDLICNVGDEPLEILQKSDAKLVKLFSVSIGLHDRFHGSSTIPSDQLLYEEKIIDTLSRIYRDLTEGQKKTIPKEVYEKFLKELPSARLEEGRPAPKGN